MQTQDANNPVSVVPERLVADSNLGVNNVLSRDKFREYTIKEMGLIADVLKPHCGPFAKYGMIVTGTGNSNIDPHMFTKDGIRLLSAVEHTALIEAYLKDSIAYIGTRVDAVAKDGTTTSMIFAANCIRYILESISDDGTMTTIDRQNTLNRLVEEIKSELIQSSLTPSIFTRTKHINAGIVAFCQAMSSSGGNLDLAKCCYQLFTSIPAVAWDMIPVSQSNMETDTPFSIVEDAYEFRLLSHFQNDNHRNVDLNTGYEAHDALVFVYPDAITPQSIITDKLSMFLGTQADPNQPIVIVATHIDASFIQFIEQANAGRPAKITLFTTIDTSRDKTGAYIITTALRVKGGAVIWDGGSSLTDDHFIHADRVVHDQRYLDFFGIVPGGITEDNTHPFYDENNTSLEYMRFVNDLLGVLSKYKSMHSAESQMGTINFLQNVLNMLICCRNVTFKIGGSTHENIANFSVVQDVIGATIASLSNNFVINGLISFRNVLIRVSTDRISDTNPGDAFTDAIVIAFLKAIDSVIGIVYGAGLKNYDMQGARKYINALCPAESDRNFYRALDISEYGELVLALMENKFDSSEQAPYEDIIRVTYPVLQPIAVYEEMLDRICELVLRLVDTAQVIVPSGVFLNSKTDE